jgi:hypothetical protein
MVKLVLPPPPAAFLGQASAARHIELKDERIERRFIGTLLGWAGEVLKGFGLPVHVAHNP